MGKRFTDTEKWKDPWFRKLPLEAKVFWEFLRDNCDQAGFWKKDYELASFLCGAELNDSIMGWLNKEKNRIKDHGVYLEILDFISFQFGHLTKDCRPHRPVLDLLKKYGFKGYLKGINTLEEKEKEKEMEKEKGGVGGFELFWGIYPKKRSKGQVEKAWAKIKPDEQLQDRILNALERAKTSADWQKDGGQFIPYPASWLNAKGWEDVPEVAVYKPKPDKSCRDCGGSGYVPHSGQKCRCAK